MKTLKMKQNYFVSLFLLVVITTFVFFLNDLPVSAAPSTEKQSYIVLDFTTSRDGSGTNVVDKPIYDPNLYAEYKFGTKPPAPEIGNQSQQAQIIPEPGGEVEVVNVDIAEYYPLPETGSNQKDNWISFVLVSVLLIGLIYLVIHNMKNKNIPFLFLLVLVCIVTNILPFSAFASDTEKQTSVTLKLNPGDILITKENLPTVYHEEYYGPKDSINSGLEIPVTVNNVLYVEDAKLNSDGWKITVSLSKFTNEKNKDIETLRGASVKIGTPSLKEELFPADTKLSYLPATLIANDGISHEIISATPYVGMGNWGFNIPIEQVSVQNGTASFGRHIAVLTWSLESTP